MTKGDRRCRQALVEAYGRVPDARRVMAYALLHVYSNMPWYMREMPAGETFDDLAVRWFGA
ncbi:hygromycin-B 7''-O-kinase [Lentzea jiangxiensis]|uniref:Hygromycin-B 7''-O-kinase n=1 Tax=Lentzea jiangxiensis TaxID=641025 RepID=A0A1H0WYD1_9PSEU|nr:hygromycin-B 7''-O-kinase [Lentzea jiangxiensis]